MYIEQLRQFCFIVEIGTVAKAATLLRMSPGALSRSMQKLASDSKLELFVPHGRKILPTDTGLKFYEVAKQTYDNLNASLVNLRQKKNSPVELRIGSFEVFSTYVIQELMTNELRDCHLSVNEPTPEST